MRFLCETQIKHMMEPDKSQYGRWLRDELTTMGPAFIKLGQFLSTRSDVIDKRITDELSHLQDRVAPTPFEQIVGVLDASLPNWSGVIRNIEPEPIASASIGQVHLATVSGKRVAVKIQKPGVDAQIHADLHMLRALNRFMIATRNPRAGELDNMLHQYEHHICMELDYVMELKNMARISSLMQGMPVRIPRAFPELSSRTLLVMEYVPSTKIDDVEALRSQGLDTDSLARTVASLYVQMIVEHGFVHADSQPANIGVSADGSIVLYDFGNMLQISKHIRDQMRYLVLALWQRDVDEFVDLMVKLRLIITCDELDVIDIKLFFSAFIKYLETLDMNTLRSTLEKQQLFAGRPPFKMDQQMLTLFRTLSLLDGTCSKLDPEFNYYDVLKPCIDEVVYDPRFILHCAQRDISKLQRLPRTFNASNQTTTKLLRDQDAMARSLNWTRMAAYGLLAVELLRTTHH